MTNDALQIKVKERLNMLDSHDYEDLQTWQILEAFNKVQLQWARSTIAPRTPGQPGDEGSKQTIDDLEILLSTVPLSTELGPDGLYEQAALPAHYLGFKRLDAFARNACCPARRLSILPCEAANVNEWLASTHYRPDFDWAETFHTLAGGHVQVYTDNKFTLLRLQLTYYHEPRPLTVPGELDLSTGQLALLDVSCELSEAICELLVDKTVGVLAGDTGNATQYQRAQQETAANS